MPLVLKSNKQGSVGRLRSTKVHLWMRPELYSTFSSFCTSRGYSRDGAFELAVRSYLLANKEYRNDR